MSTNRDVGAKSVKSWKVSEHHGAAEWLAERFTALALIPLTLWSAWSALKIAGGGFDAALAFVKAPVNAAVIGLTALICVWHMYMGLKVIIEDYIAGPLRGFLIFLVFLLSAVLLVATLGALYFVHQGA